MKTKFIYLLLLVCPVVLHAQKEFRPIIDSLMTCTYYNHTYNFSENAATSKQVLEVFHIVENMPKPNISASEIENILQSSIRLNEQEMAFNAEIYLQCIVNCKGKAGDFQIVYCSTENANISCQLLNVFREKLDNWESGKQRGSNVDVLIMIKVAMNKGKFNVVAPLY